MTRDEEILKVVAQEVAVKSGLKITLAGATNDDSAYMFAAAFGMHEACVIIEFYKPVSEFSDEERINLVAHIVKAFKRFASAHKYACEKRAAQWN